MSIIFETSLGEFTVDLFCKERPKCCENFIKLCKMKFYNYCLFHSIQHQLVAQSGDPTGSGKGGYSIWQMITGEKYFQNELKPKIKHRKSGLISMVNNGENKHGSQFFITLAENLDYLDGIHTVFGEISEGIDIVNKLNKVFIDKNNVPLREVRIYHTIILEDPFSDHPSLMFPENSPEPTEDQLISNRIGAEEDINDDSGLTEEEKQEIERIKEAQINAQILTVIGDIPDEDIKPPENVLFVCSLNPITTSEDLEVIFSRFGEILSCEVIRDYKTGNSLQYAFIEFEDKNACEEAYFHMERVLIDDRRIHVDFSQSVSKQWRSYREDLRRRKLEAINQKYIKKESRNSVEKKYKRNRSVEKKNVNSSTEQNRNENSKFDKNRREGRSIEKKQKDEEKNRKRSKSTEIKRRRSKSSEVKRESRNRNIERENRKQDKSENRDFKERINHRSRSHSRTRRNRSRDKSNRYERKRSRSYRKDSK